MIGICAPRVAQSTNVETLTNAREQAIGFTGCKRTGTSDGQARTEGSHCQSRIAGRNRVVPGWAGFPVRNGIPDQGGHARYRLAARWPQVEPKRRGGGGECRPAVIRNTYLRSSNSSIVPPSGPSTLTFALPLPITTEQNWKPECDARRRGCVPIS